MSPLSSDVWNTLETLARRDPGCRGVAECQIDGNRLLEGHLQAAAAHLAEQAQTVAILTGFIVREGNRAVAETDGPPGALYLSRALVELGIDVMLIGDAYGVPLLHAGCDWHKLPREIVYEFPFELGDPHEMLRSSNDLAYQPITNQWIEQFLASPAASRLTHLISIERVGPSHTEESLAAQSRLGPPPLEEFRQAVPVESQNVCFSMRGQPITGWTAKTHRLFEVIHERQLPITTIGIGDGGNELGMGSIPWEILRRAIRSGAAEIIPCRIAADFCVLAGVSNWGAYALALSLAALHGRLDLAKSWDQADQRQLLEMLVEQTGAIDGVTRRCEPTVDGLPQSTYLEILAGMRETLGLPA
jgi:hypothetical protein